MRFPFCAALAALFLWLGAARAPAQSVLQQLGPLTPGHLVMGVSNGQAMDAGGPPAVNQPPQNNVNPGTLPTGLGIVNSGLGHCQWTGYANAAYGTFCWGFDGSGNALLSIGQNGGAPVPTFTINLNGTNYPFPGAGNGNVVGPTSPVPLAGNMVQWNGTTAVTDAGPLGAVSLMKPSFGAKGDGSADVAAALNAAIGAAQANGKSTAIVSVPPGQYLLDGSGGTVALNHVTLECAGQPADADAVIGTGIGALGYQGATFWLTSTTVKPFTVGLGVKVRGCNFYWPNQQGASATPTAYPPLFSEVCGNQAGNVDFIDDRIINAYDFFDQCSAADSIGNIHLRGTYGYAIRYWLSLANVQETMTVSGMAADWNLFQNVANTGNQYLVKWTAANGAFLHVFGNGNGTVASTVSVGGLDIDADVFATGKLVWVDGTGALGETVVRGIADAVPHVLEVDSGGCVASATLDALYFAYQWDGGGTDNAPAFSINSSVTGCTDFANIGGQLVQAQGDVLDLTGSAIKTVVLALRGGGQYAKTSTAGTYYFANVNGANVIFDALGDHIEPATTGSGYRGYLFQSCYSCTVNGNSFNGVYNPIDTTGLSSTQLAAAAGNVARATASPTAVGGTFAHRMMASGGNRWDVLPNPVVSACGTSPVTNLMMNDVRGGFTVGSGTATSCTLTFGATWVAQPVCEATSSLGPLYPTSLTTSGIVWSLPAAANMAGAQIYYECQDSQ